MTASNAGEMDTEHYLIADEAELVARAIARGRRPSIYVKLDAGAVAARHRAHLRAAGLYIRAANVRSHLPPEDRS